MTTTLSRFKTVGAAFLLAATLGTAGLAVTPAFAQGEPPAGFSLGVPDGNNQEAPQQGQMEMGAPDHEEATGRYNPNTDDFDYCLEDDEIIDGLLDYGFSRPRIVRYLRGERVEVNAYWGRKLYSMRIDRCTGSVDRVRLIRRSGFGLQFNFGN